MLENKLLILRQFLLFVIIMIIINQHLRGLWQGFEKLFFEHRVLNKPAGLS